jgi:hypothetical protein
MEGILDLLQLINAQIMRACFQQASNMHASMSFACSFYDIVQ